MLPTATCRPRESCSLQRCHEPPKNNKNNTTQEHGTSEPLLFPQAKTPPRSTEPQNLSCPHKQKKHRPGARNLRTFRGSTSKIRTQPLAGTPFGPPQYLAPLCWPPPRGAGGVGRVSVAILAQAIYAEAVLVMTTVASGNAPAYWRWFTYDEYMRFCWETYGVSTASLPSFFREPCAQDAWAAGLRRAAKCPKLIRWSTCKVGRRSEVLVLELCILVSPTLRAT